MADESGAGVPTGDLVRRAADDDPTAWTALVARYERRVWLLVRTYRLEPHDAEDAAQDVWLIVAQQLTGLRDPARFGAWLRAITRNECLRHVRAARRCVPVSNELLDRPHENGPESAHAAREGLGAVRAALDRLGEPDRRVAVLRLEAPDLSPHEVAALSGVAPSALPTVRRRAFRRLRAMLSAEREMSAGGAAPAGARDAGGRRRTGSSGAGSGGTGSGGVQAGAAREPRRAGKATENEHRGHLRRG